MKINNSTINYTNTARQNTPLKSNKNVSFGSEIKVPKSLMATMTEATNKIWKPFLTKASGTKVVQNIANSLTKSNKGISRLLLIDSIVLSSFYMFNTAKNKKIKKEQKLPLIINQALVFAAATFCTYKVEHLVKGKIQTFIDAFRSMSLEKYAGQSNQVIKDATKKIDKTIKGIDSIKSIVIFGMIYRFLTPVLMTPLANKLSAKIQKNKKPITEQAPNAPQTATTANNLNTKVKVTA